MTILFWRNCWAAVRIGEVWRAIRTSIGKSCAIKFLNSVDEQEKKDRFDREIQILASLDHPYIVQIQEKGEAWSPQSENIVPYYVMEFLPGKPIHKALNDLPQDSRLDALCVLFQQVCSALSAAHARGISHGDIKPANILIVGKERVAKLSDLGFGLLPGESKKTRIHYPNSSYRVPKALNPIEADVYRLGKTLEECGNQVRELQPLATREISSLAKRLIQAPADVSLTEAASIIEQIRTTNFKAPSHDVFSDVVPELLTSDKSGKLISDPVHGVQNYSERVMDIANCPFFQRLREIQYIPSGQLVYPALTISAFEQALGVHSTLIRQLLWFNQTTTLRLLLTPKQLSTTILAGLLLSAARGPFHIPLNRALRNDPQIFDETVFNFLHEIPQNVMNKWGVDIDLLSALLRNRGPYWLEENAGRRLMVDLLRGPLSAMDFEWVFRISTRIGFQPGIILLDFISALAIFEKGQMAVRAKGGLRTLESFYFARSQVIERVFNQPTIRAADLMLEHAFALLHKEGLDFRQLIESNDNEFFSSCLHHASKAKNTAAVQLLTNYRQRSVYQKLFSMDTDERADSPWWDFDTRDALSDAVSSKLESRLQTSLAPGSIILDGPHYLRILDPLVFVDNEQVRGASEVSASFAALQESTVKDPLTIYVSQELYEKSRGRLNEVIDVMRATLEKNQG